VLSCAFFILNHLCPGHPKVKIHSSEFGGNARLVAGMDRPDAPEFESFTDNVVAHRIFHKHQGKLTNLPAITPVGHFFDFLKKNGEAIFPILSSWSVATGSRETA